MFLILLMSLAMACDHAAFARLRDKFPDIESIKLVRKPGETQVVIRVDGITEAPATIRYKVEDGALSYVVHVDNPARHMGFNKLLVEDTLKRNPGVTRIENELVLTNAANLVLSLTNKGRPARYENIKSYQRECDKELALQLKSLDTGAKRAAFLKHALLIYQTETPAGRIAGDLGFGHVAKLTFRIKPGPEVEILVVDDKGEGPTELVIDDLRRRR